MLRVEAVEVPPRREVDVEYYRASHTSVDPSDTAETYRNPHEFTVVHHSRRGEGLLLDSIEVEVGLRIRRTTNYPYDLFRGQFLDFSGPHVARVPHSIVEQSRSHLVGQLNELLFYVLYSDAALFRVPARSRLAWLRAKLPELMSRL